MNQDILTNEIDILDKDIIYKKLLEAEKEMEQTNKRYNTDQIVNSIKNIIGVK